jgi:hypothetical protein
MWPLPRRVLSMPLQLNSRRLKAAGWRHKQREQGSNVSDQKLDEILKALNLRQQRATYGAVAALVDRPPAFLMGGRPRDPYHSWIVNQETGLPTGYEPAEMHPALRSSAEVLRTSQQLEDWLRTT